MSNALMFFRAPCHLSNESSTFPRMPKFRLDLDSRKMFLYGGKDLHKIEIDLNQSTYNDEIIAENLIEFIVEEGVVF